MFVFVLMNDEIVNIMKLCVFCKFVVDGGFDFIVYFVVGYSIYNSR